MPALIIVEQQEGFRRDLAAALAALDPELAVHGVDSLEELAAVLAHCDPIQLVLVDLRLSVSATVSKLVRLRMVHPGLRVALLAGQVGRREVMDCAAAGLAGIIPKAQPVQDIARAVLGMVGAPAVPSTGGATAADDGLRALARLALVSGLAPAPGAATARLTQRQREVLTLISQGLTNKEIARKLNIAEPTAKIHVAALMRILGVRSRGEVAGFSGPSGKTV